MLHKAVIFDLDGTLLDSMNVWHETDERFLAEKNCVIPEDFSKSVQTLSIDEAADYFIRRFNLNNLTREYVSHRIEELVSNEYSSNLQLKPYALETLGMLKKAGIPCCIATATYPSLVNAAADRLHLTDYVDFILTCDEVGESKCSPKIFFECAERFGVKPDEVIVVEDSLHAIETAVAAGFFTVSIDDDFSEPERERIYKLSDFNAQDLRGFSDFIRNTENI